MQSKIILAIALFALAGCGVKPLPLGTSPNNIVLGRQNLLGQTLQESFAAAEAHCQTHGREAVYQRTVPSSEGNHDIFECRRLPAGADPPR